jgi:hypothetical protein
VNLRILAPLECECGWAMRRLDRPLRHLAVCDNSRCPLAGEFVELPKFEVLRGRFYPSDKKVEDSE